MIHCYLPTRPHPVSCEFFYGQLTEKEKEIQTLICHLYLNKAKIEKKKKEIEARFTDVHNMLLSARSGVDSHSFINPLVV